MFANGSDYDAFLEKNCYKCPRFVHYEDATEENPICVIEEKIAMAACGVEEVFPYEWLDKNEKHMPTYNCRKFKGKEKLLQTTPDEAQKIKEIEIQKFDRLVDLPSVK